MDWVHCNKCFCLPGDPERPRKFFLTSCGHIFCEPCAPTGGGGGGDGSDSKCFLCNTVCQTIHLTADMKPDVERFFTDPRDTLKKTLQVCDFQRDHRSRLVGYFRQLNAKLAQCGDENAALRGRLQELEAENKRLRDALAQQQQQQQFKMTPQPSPHVDNRAMFSQSYPVSSHPSGGGGSQRQSPMSAGSQHGGGGRSPAFQNGGRSSTSFQNCGGHPIPTGMQSNDMSVGDGGGGIQYTAYSSQSVKLPVAMMRAMVTSPSSLDRSPATSGGFVTQERITLKRVTPPQRSPSSQQQQNFAPGRGGGGGGSNRVSPAKSRPASTIPQMGQRQGSLSSLADRIQSPPGFINPRNVYPATPPSPAESMRSVDDVSPCSSVNTPGAGGSFRGAQMHPPPMKRHGSIGRLNSSNSNGGTPEAMSNSTFMMRDLNVKGISPGGPLRPGQNVAPGVGLQRIPSYCSPPSQGPAPVNNGSGGVGLLRRISTFCSPPNSSATITNSQPLPQLKLPFQTYLQGGAR